jgi:excisionase family DNA binding protein
MANAEFPVESRLVRVAEVAKHLSLSRSKIYQLMDAGELAYVKFGKSRRVPMDAVEKLVHSSTVGASS